MTTATPQTLIDAVVRAARPLHLIVGQASDLRNGFTDDESEELMACVRLALPTLATAVQAARDEGGCEFEPYLLEAAAAAVALLAESGPGSRATEAGLGMEWILDAAFGMLHRVLAQAPSKD